MPIRSILLQSRLVCLRLRIGPGSWLLWQKGILKREIAYLPRSSNLLPCSHCHIDRLRYGNSSRGSGSRICRKLSMQE